MLLHLVEFLGQVVGGGIFTPVDDAGLKRLIHFRESHDLRNRTEIAEVSVGDLRPRDPHLDPLEVRRVEQRPVRRDHVEPVVPIGEALDALGFELLEQPPADLALHGARVGRLIRE